MTVDHKKVDNFSFYFNQNFKKSITDIGWVQTKVFSEETNESVALSPTISTIRESSIIGVAPTTILAFIRIRFFIAAGFVPAPWFAITFRPESTATATSGRWLSKHECSNDNQ